MRHSRKTAKARTKRAADAVTRLYSGSVTEEEQQSLESWLEQDAENRREYQAMLEIWDLAGDAELDGEIVRMAEGRASRFAGIRLSGVVLKSAAAAVLVAGIFAWVISSTPLLSGYISDELTSYETDIGEQREVVLSDGSIVVLNTNTRLIVDFNDDRRRIVMNRGEAFFDIHRDPGRPLTIMVGGRSVSVLGTKFSVRWSGPEVLVAVVEGTVSVHSSSVSLGKPQVKPVHAAEPEGTPAGPGTGEVILDTGSVARFSETFETEIAQEPQRVQRLQSWRFGLSRFENETLERVVGEINRYSRTRIVIEDPSVRELRLTGVFRFSDIDAVLRGLQEVLPIRVIDEGDEYIIVGGQRGTRRPDITVNEPT